MTLVDTDLLSPGKTSQPRTHFDQDALQELADSIAEHGILQPLIVRPSDSPGRFEIIAGERRWRAAGLAQVDQVPVIVRDVEDQEARELALIENLQREDLNKIEEARAMRRLCDEHNLTQLNLAQRLGKRQSHVSQVMKLLELPGRVIQLVEEGQLSYAVVRELAPLPHAAQLSLAERAASEGLSSRALKRLIKTAKGEQTDEPTQSVKDPNVERLEQDLSALGYPVSIRDKGKGSGELVIRYSSLDELDGIIARYRGKRH